MTVPVHSVILVGAGGFGAHYHLPNIAKYTSLGRVRLIGIVDPTLPRSTLNPNEYAIPTSDSNPTGSLQPSSSSSGPVPIIPPNAPIYDTLTEAIEKLGAPSIVIIATPIHFHSSITKTALRAGSDVLLEKPPFATLEEYHDVLKVEKETGRKVQVAFQSLGSLALPPLTGTPNASSAMTNGVENGHSHENGDMNGVLGDVLKVRAKGCWLRRQSYFNRSKWIGMRSIGTTHINGGVSTNSLAHAIITALHIAGIKTENQIEKVEVEKYRANKIDVDDTTTMRITGKDGKIIMAGLTLCAKVQSSPEIEIIGSKGSALFSYVTDDITYRGKEGGEMKHFERINLLENLMDYKDSQGKMGLLVPLESTGSFMKVAEAIKEAEEPIHIPRTYISTEDVSGDPYPVVQDVEEWIDKALESDSLFSEVGVPWSFAKKDKIIYNASIKNSKVFEIQDGNGCTPSSSPRPYLHPIKTVGGVIVSDTKPSDHDWHNGLCFAIPDIDGISYWGGGTYVHGKGYVNLDNHGKIISESIEPLSNLKAKGLEGIIQTNSWIDNRGKKVIEEKQEISWRPIPKTTGWQLNFRTNITAVNGDISIGGPGTNGRKNAGYGGFTWRLPRCTNTQIFSNEKEGEDEVHGSKSDWIAWVAKFEHRPECCGDATIIVIPEDEVTKNDPWIVRCRDYPGIGSAIAWEDRVEVKDGESVSRGFKIVIFDGRVERNEVQHIIDGLNV